MKNSLKKLAFAALVMAIIVPAAQAEVNVCGLIQQMGGVFKTLRTLAFVGAAFVIAGWAWTFIVKGKADLDGDLKGKGIALIVGFTLLFGIGIVLSFLGPITGCVTSAFGG